jgi:hypothetical protein
VSRFINADGATLPALIDAARRNVSSQLLLSVEFGTAIHGKWRWAVAFVKLRTEP